MTVVAKYTAFPGIHTKRSISKAEWKKIGIDYDDVVLDCNNDFTLDITDAPTEVVEYFKHDDGFVVTTSPEGASAANEAVNSSVTVSDDINVTLTAG